MKKHVVYTGLLFDDGYVLSTLKHGFHDYKKEDGRYYFIDNSGSYYRTGFFDDDYTSLIIYNTDPINVVRKKLYFQTTDESGYSSNLVFVNLQTATINQLKKLLNSISKDKKYIKHFIYLELATRI